MRSESTYVLKTKALYNLVNISLYICFRKKLFCLQTTSLRSHDRIVVQRFVAPGSVVDDRMSQVCIMSLYCKERTNTLRTFTFLIYFDQYWYRHMCNNCNAVQDSGFQSNFRNNVTTSSQLFYAVYGTHSKTQIHVINVIIYHFKQTYGMN